MTAEIWSATDRFFPQFGSIFCPFTLFCHIGPFFALLHPPPPLSAHKMKISKRSKSPWRYIILYNCIKNNNHRLYCSWDVAPKSPKNQISKIMEKHLEISSFYTGVPKFMIRWCTVFKIWCGTDGWTDGRTEKVRYRGGCPT